MRVLWGYAEVTMAEFTKHVVAGAYPQSSHSGNELYETYAVCQEESGCVRLGLLGFNRVMFIVPIQI